MGDIPAILPERRDRGALESANWTHIRLGRSEDLHPRAAVGTGISATAGRVRFDMKASTADASGPSGHPTRKGAALVNAKAPADAKTSDKPMKAVPLTSGPSKLPLPKAATAKPANANPEIAKAAAGGKAELDGKKPPAAKPVAGKDKTAAPAVKQREASRPAATLPPPVKAPKAANHPEPAKAAAPVKPAHPPKPPATVASKTTSPPTAPPAARSTRAATRRC